jgi:dihydroneopterin aldolase
VDIILVEGLRVEAVIGVFDWERQITQPVLVDLVLRTDISRAALTDDIADAVNYKSVCDQVSQLIIDTKAQLLEHLAEKIAYQILTDFAIESIKITLRKPQAIAQAVAVGVSIERTRDFIRTRTGV